MRLSASSSGFNSASPTDAPSHARCLRELVPKSLRDLGPGGERRAREENGKFIAAKASNGIRGAKVRAHDRYELPQGLVAGCVAAGDH